MKLNLENAKLLTLLLVSFYLMLLVTGFYHVVLVYFIAFALMIALGEVPFAFYSITSFFEEKLCVQLRD
jgi:hypothetical protein